RDAIDPGRAARSCARAYSDTVDLDARVLRETRDRDRRARGRIAAEVARADLIHLLKVAHVREEDRRLRDVVHLEARGAEHRAQVVERAPRFRFDAPLHHLLGGGIEPDLAGAVDDLASARADPLAIGADRFGGLVRRYLRSRHRPTQRPRFLAKIKRGAR